MNKYAVQILNIINESNTHLTADQIYYQMKQQGSKAVLATVYNNLNKLVDLKLIHRLPIDGDADVYDKIIRHDHLICQKCGSIKDVFLQNYIHQFADESQHKIQNYELKLFYICEQCSKQAR